MKRLTFIVILVFLIFNGCSTLDYKTSFENFNTSTASLSKNTQYCFDQLFLEEIDTRIAESLRKETFKPEDIEPQVLSWSQLQLRKELISSINTYAKLLTSLVIKDYQKEIYSNAASVKTSLEIINSYQETAMERPAFEGLDTKSISIFTTLVTGITEAITETGRRTFLNKIMSHYQPIIESLSQKLITEMETSASMIDNFYERQFLITVTIPWPDKEAGRDKFAKLGAAVLDRKRKIDTMIKEVINTLELLPVSHRQLWDLVRYKKEPLSALVQLTAAAGRLEAMYDNYAKEKKQK